MAHPNPASRFTPARLVLALAACGLASGCAAPNGPTLAQDPWEGTNRAIYRFNDAVDQALIKPVTLAYTQLTPEPARNCIGNIFSNLGDVWSAGNSLLQARPHDFINTVGRVLFNSTMGLGGCFDVATQMGSQRIHNDFGITLGVWGLNSGPYLVLPLLGPSTVRDGSALAASFVGDFSPSSTLFRIKRIRLRNSLVGLYSINARAGLLETQDLVADVALDPYSFVRDAYLQRRASQVGQRRAGGASLPDYEDDLPDYSDDGPAPNDSDS